MNTQHPGPQFTDAELHAIEAEDVANQARIRTHKISPRDGVFEPIDNSNTSKFLAAMEVWRNDIEVEERLPQPVAVDVEAEPDRVNELLEKRWLSRILATGPHDLAALDAGELRILALQARNFEDRIRERGNLFSAEVNRRSRVELTRASDAPDYLKAKA